MSVNDSDGVVEVLEGHLRVLLTTAGQVGEAFARKRQQQLAHAQAHDEREARELATRIAAQRAVARAELGAVYREQWWAQATPQQVADTYQLARAWAEEDPEAARAGQRIGDEVRTRYGVDVDQLHAQVAEQRQARAGEPTFELLRRLDNGRSRYRRLSKVEALALIGQLPVDEPLYGYPPGTGTVDDVVLWKGKDPDVDRAITEKFPHLAITFPVSWREEDTSIAGQISKDQALTRIAEAAADERRANTYELKGWLGKDSDVDRAIAETFPHLLTDQERAALLTSEPATVRQADTRVVKVSQEKRHDSRATRHEAAEALALLAQADLVEQAAQASLDALAGHAPGDGVDAGYDSAERRAATATQLQSEGLAPAVVDTLMRADISQAKPATEATRDIGARRAKAPKARRSAARRTQAERGETGR